MWETVVVLEPLSPQNRQQPWQRLPGGKQEPASKFSPSALANRALRLITSLYADQINNKLRAVALALTTRGMFNSLAAGLASAFRTS